LLQVTFFVPGFAPLPEQVLQTVFILTNISFSAPLTASKKSKSK